MRHVLQPPKSRQCGQACLAMVLGITLAEAIKLLGHDHGTRTREIIAALRGRGFETDERLRVCPKGPPRDGLCEFVVANEYVVAYAVHRDFAVALEGTISITACNEDDARIQAHVQVSQLPSVCSLIGPSKGAVQLVSVLKVPNRG